MRLNAGGIQVSSGSGHGWLRAPWRRAFILSILGDNWVTLQIFTCVCCHDKDRQEEVGNVGTAIPQMASERAWKTVAEAVLEPVPGYTQEVPSQ